MRILTAHLQDEGLQAEHQLGEVVLQVVVLDVVGRVELSQGLGTSLHKGEQEALPFQWQGLNLYLWFRILLHYLLSLMKLFNKILQLIHLLSLQFVHLGLLLLEFLELPAFRGYSVLCLC